MSELRVLKAAGHSNAKAFVKSVMHCRLIDVTPKSPAEETVLRFSAGKWAPADVSRLETLGSICVLVRTCICTHALRGPCTARWDELLVKSHFSKTMMTEHSPDDPVCPVRDHRNSLDRSCARVIAQILSAVIIPVGSVISKRRNKNWWKKKLHINFIVRSSNLH